MSVVRGSIHSLVFAVNDSFLKVLMSIEEKTDLLPAAKSAYQSELNQDVFPLNDVS